MSWQKLAQVLWFLTILATGAEGQESDAEALKELKANITNLRVADVEWRKISWKTCLLEGLRASAEQDKPIIVWMFIDLPRDDKRC